MGMKYEIKNEDRTEKNAFYARIFSWVTLIGSFSLGVGIMLSELVYPEIEELSLCPLWYRIFLLASLIVSSIGAVGCAIFKKTDDVELKAIYKKETNRSFALTVIGIILMFVVAFSEEESKKYDLIITVGGAVCSIGFFSWIGSAIGVDRSREKYKYKELLSKMAKSKPFLSIEEKTPTKLEDIIALEEYLGEMIPTELLNFYRESDGDGDLMFSAKETLETTKLVHKNFSEFVPAVKDIMCFAGNGAGDYFCYAKFGDYFKSEVIYAFDHETLEIYPVARTLYDLIGGYYSCQ